MRLGAASDLWESDRCEGRGVHRPLDTEVKTAFPVMSATGNGRALAPELVVAG